MRRNKQNTRHFVMSEENCCQNLLQDRTPQQVLNYHNPSVFGIDKQPFEVKLVDKLHQESVQLLLVCDGVDPGVADLAGDDAPGAHLPGVPALGGGAAQVHHHRVLLGYQTYSLV